MSSLRKAFLYIISPFSRVANKINWRAGRPYRSSFETVRPLLGSIEPGMVILSHKNYELTNLFINGYWTHVAMLADGFVIEAVSRGVIRTPVDRFFSSVDDWIILEPVFCPRCSMKKAVAYMEQYIGYPYNFVFMPSENAFTCIDLVCKAYELPVRKGKTGNVHPLDLIGYFSRDIILPESILELSTHWRIFSRSGSMSA